MKNLLVIFAFVCTFIGRSFSQEIVHLYEGSAPGSEEWNYNEVVFANPGTETKMIRNVVNPTLEVFMPEKSLATGTAVIICPGGGNVWLSYESEGTAVAKWLVEKGVTAFVLKYRLNKTPEKSEEFEEYWNGFGERIKAMKLDKKNTAPKTSTKQYYGGDDGLQAVKYVKENANEYNVNPDKIGIMGFSAGAGVTMHVILNSVEGYMPNFAAPIYGGWLKGENVPENAPPLFILCAADDPIAAGSPNLYKAWRDAGKSAELHIYSKGGHGFGMDQYGLPVNNWIERFYEWLVITGF